LEGQGSMQSDNG